MLIFPFLSSLVAYFTQANVDSLHTVDDVPQLAEIRDLIPPGKYITARSANKPRNGTRVDDHDNGDEVNPSGDANVSSPSTSKHMGDDSPSDGGASDTADATVTVAGPTRVTLPALKPPPWRDPDWVLENLGPGPRLPDRHGAQAQPRAHPRYTHERAMPPLIYMMTSPYPPRHPADNDLLKMFDIGMV